MLQTDSSFFCSIACKVSFGADMVAPPAGAAAAAAAAGAVTPRVGKAAAAAAAGGEDDSPEARTAGARLRSIRPLLTST
jgi:hypothetical protein